LRNIVGKYGTGMRNERGELLLDFCAENNLFIANSNFEHHIRRLYTWQSPCGQYRNQIDYILLRNRWKLSIRDVNTYPGMDCGSDHNALVAEVCLKLQKNPKSKQKPFRWDSESTDHYSREVTKALKHRTMQRSEAYSAEKLWQ
jgi:hypothetical protein